MEELKREFAGKGLQIIAVSADSHENTIRYQQDHSMSLTELVDQYGKALKEFKIRGLPTTRLVDIQGSVLYRALGRVDWKQ